MAIKNKSKYRRITEDEYEIQRFYSGAWETVTTETTCRAAIAQRKCYQKQETRPYRIIKKRIKIIRVNE